MFILVFSFSFGETLFTRDNYYCYSTEDLETGFLIEVGMFALIDEDVFLMGGSSELMDLKKQFGPDTYSNLEGEERIKKELDGCINSVWTTPNTNNQEHRNQHGFKEYVEQHSVLCSKHTVN